jgi:hypothetical protein
MIAIINCPPCLPTLSPEAGGEGVDWAAGFWDETEHQIALFFSLSPMGERVG